jgi:hypothetical protein
MSNRLDELNAVALKVLGHWKRNEFDEAIEILQVSHPLVTATVCMNLNADGRGKLIQRMARIAKNETEFEWVVGIKVDETWVADGFSLSDPEKAHDRIYSALLPYARPDEIEVRVIATSDEKRIRKVQGYRD